MYFVYKVRKAMSSLTLPYTKDSLLHTVWNTAYQINAGIGSVLGMGRYPKARDQCISNAHTNQVLIRGNVCLPANSCTSLILSLPSHTQTHTQTHMHAHTGSQ